MLIKVNAQIDGSWADGPSVSGALPMLGTSHGTADAGTTFDLSASRRVGSYTSAL